MKNYKLLVQGYGIDGSAHSLSESEVEKIFKHKEDNDYESLLDLYGELDEILENYDEYSTNMWVTTTSIVNSKLSFVLIDENEEVVWRADMDQLSETWDDTTGFTYPENVDDHEKDIYAFPYDENPNILLTYHEVKGTIMNYTIESEEVPQPSDFAMTIQSMETPKYELELVDKVFFKGKELDREYDNEDYRVKATEIEVFTLEAVENGDYDEE
jgi:hypothetical protein